VATILSFPNVSNVRTSSDGRPNASPEVVVFPRTNIRVLRKLWGLPEYGLLVAGPDGRAVGALGDDAVAGHPSL
jgi:hypothetical protein